MGDIVRKRGHYVYTEGRRKNMINRGGEKISCDEVENLIFGLPQVKEVGLGAMPDPVFGAKAGACVVLKPGEPALYAPHRGCACTNVRSFSVNAAAAGDAALRVARYTDTRRVNTGEPSLIMRRP